MSSRRDVLAGALPALACAAAPATAIAAPANRPGGISRAEYDRYMQLYNAADPGFASFYHRDVVLETVPPLVGVAAIAQFQRDLRVYMNEHIIIEHYVSDATGAAAQHRSEFTCVRDVPANAFSGLFGKAVNKGQKLKHRGIILYGAKDGKFTVIRTFPPVVLQDWS